MNDLMSSGPDRDAGMGRFDRDTCGILFLEPVGGQAGWGDVRSGMDLACAFRNEKSRLPRVSG